MSKKDGKVAKRYAKALFDLYAFAEGRDKSDLQLRAVSTALNSFAQSWSEHEHLRDILSNPGVPISQRLAVLKEKAKLLRAGDFVFENFLCVLLENKRLDYIELIAANFLDLVKQFERIFSLHIVSAFPLDESEKQKMQEEIRSKLPKEFAGLTTVSWDVDPHIIGGLMIQAGDKLLDSSIRGSLEKIHKELSQAARSV